MTTQPQDWNLEEAARLYLKQLWTYGQIADRYGLSTPTVWQRMAQHPTIKILRNMKQERLYGTEAVNKGETQYNRQEHNRSKVDHEEAARLFDKENWTLYQLGDKYGVTHQRIQQILKKRHPEVLERRHEQQRRNIEARERAEQAKQTRRAALDRDYDTAIELYRNGSSIRELRPLYPNLNWSTFNLRITKIRENDPTFPGERSTGGRDWSWAPRVKAALNHSKNYTEAAKLLGLEYGTFVQRVAKMRTKGLLP